MLKPVSTRLANCLSGAKSALTSFDARVASVNLPSQSTLTNKTAGTLLAMMVSREEFNTSFSSTTKTLANIKRQLSKTLVDARDEINDVAVDKSRWLAVASHISDGALLPKDLPAEVLMAAKTVRAAHLAGLVDAVVISAEMRRDLTAVDDQIDDAQKRLVRVTSAARVASAKRFAMVYRTLSDHSGFSLMDRKLFAKTADMTEKAARQRLAAHRVKHGRDSWN